MEELLKALANFVEVITTIIVLLVLYLIFFRDW